MNNKNYGSFDIKVNGVSYRKIDVDGTYYYDFETYYDFEAIRPESEENKVKRIQMEKAIERSEKIDKILS